MRLILKTIAALSMAATVMTATAWAQSTGQSGGYDYLVAPGAPIPDKLQEVGPGQPPGLPPGAILEPQGAPMTAYVPGQEAFNRDCHRVVADGYWQGRWAQVGGMMCYDAAGQGFVHPNSIHLLHYYPTDPNPAPNQRISRAYPMSPQPGVSIDPLDMLQMLSIGLSFGVGGGGC